MDRNAYLEALDRALAALVPYQERMNILRYYEEYFDEAGPEGEAAIIEELGDPQALARRLAAEGGYGVPGQDEPARNGAGPVPAPAPRKGRGVIAAVIIGVVALLLILAAIAAAALSRLMIRPGDGERESVPPGSSAQVQGPGTSQDPAASQNVDSGDGWTSLRGEEFTKVDVEVGLADVTVVAGEDYSVYLEWDSGSNYYLSYTLRQGELKVTSSKKSLSSTTVNNVQVTITVPQGVTLRDIDVETGLGDVYVEGVSAADVSCETGLGDIGLISVTASEASGQTGMGGVTWQGALCRETELETGMGDVLVTVQGPAADWSYELSSGLGQVTVDGVNMGRDARQRGGASGKLEASSGMGNVTVEFDG